MMFKRATALASVLLAASPAIADKAAVLGRVNTLIEAPSPKTPESAKAAWLAARVPYQQTEVYRFGNAIVDDWEGEVNAWPLDVGLIDYVHATDENAYTVLNAVANPAFTLSGQTVDAAQVTPALLEGALHEADGVESHVAMGYHAIEFLLWGQDLNGHGPDAGNRAWDGLRGR